MPSKLSVIIPAFNEAQSIGRTLLDLQSTCADMIEEIIVVDDGSSDDTGQIAAAHGARVITHPRNLGYGASLKSGLREARADLALTIDADGQHRAADVPALYAAAESSDMVVGARQGLLHSQLWRMPGKWMLWSLANYLSQQSIPDLNSGLRILRRSVALKYIHLCPSGFSFSTTITLALLNRGGRVRYVPIQVNPRTGHSTVSVSTGLDTLILILRLAALFNPLRIFLPISLLSIAAGVLWGIPYLLARRGLSVAAMLAIVTGILLFGLGLLSDQISQLRLERYE